MGMQVIDIDADLRVLALVDDGRLVEIDARGSRTLAEVAGARTAAYLPGARTVAVEHGGISLLDPDSGKLTAVVDGPARLLGTLPGRIGYLAGDEVRIRNVLTGEEQAVYDRGGPVLEATVSDDSRFVALRLAETSLLVATMPETEDDHLRPLGADGDGLAHLRWLGSAPVVVATATGRRPPEVVRFGAETGECATVTTADSPETFAVPAPDGRLLAIAGTGLTLYDARTGREERVLTAESVHSGPVWSPDSRHLAFTTASGDSVLATVDSGERRTLEP